MEKNRRGFKTQSKKEVRMKIELTQIRIEGWSLDVGANFEDLYKIYEHVLQNDDWWHFFREGDYTLIRCLNKNVKQVSKLLEIEH